MVRVNLGIASVSCQAYIGRQGRDAKSVLYYFASPTTVKR